MPAKRVKPIWIAALLSFVLILHGGPKRSFYTLENGRVIFKVTIKDGSLSKEALQIKVFPRYETNTNPVEIKTSGDFALDIMWTGWRAPEKYNNSENPIVLTKEDFIFEKAKKESSEDRVQKLSLYFKHRYSSLRLKIVYRLAPDDFFIKRKLVVQDKRNLHFLRRFSTYSAQILDRASAYKTGGYGQPAAVVTDKGGAFWGIEYPTSVNILKKNPEGELLVQCSQWMGEKISAKGVESEWTVWGITPDRRVKYWFFKYLDGIRVAPLRPYLLYNSWYDLRAPEMVKAPENVMNEENVRRIIKLFEDKLVRKHGIKLDAFVLDDGWDVYRSDWKLSEEQFPNGLQPIASLLKKMGTDLGIWFGPIGGYSHRDWRVGWMKAHGYEVVGDQLCLAGKKYKELFKRRVVEFVEKYRVGYYKWDGIQFSCSEPDHGHPTGIYSRRAVMEAVIEMCRAVREKNPGIFLNITSGTWLSPWWLKYANQIWMQGYDYGYASVPSISRRDRAITYRDYVLYDDFKRKQFWFPISNLMTHGIIKGHLQKLGGEKEPIDKFTDNAVLYFARGITMYELYISPDLLTDAEWNAIAGAIKWAKDRFSILSSYTEMIGGDPGKGEAYGYTHFKGHRGILTLRNPSMEAQIVTIKLTPEFGLEKDAANLVLERIYPNRWISPVLYRAGDEIRIKLSGFETAIYELYPLKEASVPLIAGAPFHIEKISGKDVFIRLYPGEQAAKLLNPGSVKWIEIDGKKVSDLSSLKKEIHPARRISFKKIYPDQVEFHFKLPSATREATFALLVRSENKEASLPEVKIFVEGKASQAHMEKQKGLWAWYTVSIGPEVKHVKLQFEKPLRKKWKGTVAAWLIYREKMEPVTLHIRTRKKAKDRPLLPLPYPCNLLQKVVKLAQTQLEL